MSMLILVHSLTQAHYMTKEEKNKLTRYSLRHWYENHQEEYCNFTDLMHDRRGLGYEQVMSRKFRQVASEEEYIDVFSPILSKFDGLLAHYTQNSPNAVETSRDIRNLMPLHPATALLATFYAREAGSASRSVFEFLGDNKTIREFLDSEDIFLNRHTITADYLWDYVVDEFNENVAKFGAVTERFNTYRAQIEDAGDVEYRVFKGILLLNALGVTSPIMTMLHRAKKMCFASLRVRHLVISCPPCSIYLTQRDISNGHQAISSQFSLLPFRQRKLRMQRNNCGLAILSIFLKSSISITQQPRR